MAKDRGTAYAIFHAGAVGHNATISRKVPAAGGPNV
jgi:hypothetical protein